MKIALIGTQGSSILGFRRLLVKRLLEGGHEVHAFASQFSDEQMACVRAMGAIPVRFRMNRNGTNPLTDIVDCLRLARELRHLSLDLVFCYFAKPVIFGTLAAVMAGVSRRYGMLEGLGYYFTDHHGGVGQRHRLIRTIQLVLFRVSLPRLTGLIVLNEDDRRLLLVDHAISARRVDVLGGIGVDLTEYPFSTAPTAPFRFLFMGRLLREKGIDLFLAAAETVKQQHAEVEFHVIGWLDPGNPGGLDVSRLQRLHDEKIIHYHGVVRNVPDHLKQASVFVLPSYYREGVPRSTQEAMAVGRAVITTDSTGCRDTVVPGVNGLLIPPHDIRALIQAMETLIADPNKVAEMGRMSRRLAEQHFDDAKVTARLLNFLGLEATRMTGQEKACST